jgi:hypothetical protein
LAASCTVVRLAAVASSQQEARGGKPRAVFILKSKQEIVMLHDPSKVKLNLSTPVVTGYLLALNKMSATERAFTAARLVLGQLSLVEPRATQAAKLARTPIAYVRAALEVLGNGPEFEPAVCAGKMSLFEAAVLAKHPEPTLVDKFRTATAAERAVFAKATGPATLWDELISPYV